MSLRSSTRSNEMLITNKMYTEKHKAFKNKLSIFRFDKQITRQYT